MDEEKIKKIIIVIILLLIGIILFRACSPKPSYTQYQERPKKQENKFVTIIKMPFFYVLEYPKIIMGIGNGDITEDGSTSSKGKQYIKF